MKARIEDGFNRISKLRARKLYDDGKIVYLCPVKLRPGYPWHPEVAISKHNERTDGLAQYFVSDTNEFDKVVNDFTHYNCNWSAGTYPAYYVREEDRT